MSETTDIIVYEKDQNARLQVKTDGETVWLTQAQMCQLLGRDRSVITKHINNAIREGEISEKSNVQNLHIANSDKPVKFYDLDVVISVGYRVKSLQRTLFRPLMRRRTRSVRRGGAEGTAQPRASARATKMLREMLLRRLDEAKSITKLSQRVTKVETDVAQLKGGMNYLVKQLSAPPDPPRRRIGFNATPEDTPAKPYGKLTTNP